jgi:hypothetical protein
MRITKTTHVVRASMYMASDIAIMKDFERNIIPSKK